MGGISIDEHGTPLLPEVLERCRAADAVLLGAVGGPKWDTTDPDAPRPEQGLLGLRKGLELFANLRPVRVVPALASASPLREERVARRGPDDRARADGRHLLRRPRPARRRRPRHVRLLGRGDEQDRRAGLRASRPRRRGAAASPPSTRPTSSRRRACGARRSSGSPPATRMCSSSTCWSTTPPCS